MNHFSHLEGYQCVWCCGTERLTILRSCDMSKDAEGLGLKVGGTPGPLRHLRFLIIGFDHSLVNRRGAVHERVLNRK